MGLASRLRFGSPLVAALLLSACQSTPPGQTAAARAEEREKLFLFAHPDPPELLGAKCNSLSKWGATNTAHKRRL